MNNNIEELLEKVNSLSNYEKEDKFYQYFIDNQISRDTLKTLLDIVDAKYLNDLFQKPDWYIKSYRCHTLTKVKFEKDSYYQTTREIFNIHYFRYLCLRSKKNKEMTSTLINYSRELSNMVIHIMTMKNVKLNNINYYLQRIEWQIIATDFKCKTLFDFYKVLSEIKQKKYKNIDINNVMNQFTNYMAESKSFGFDMTNHFNNFCLDMEVLLSTLTEKVANTFRIKFLIYKENYLEPNEYNSNITNCRMLISKNKGSLSSTKIIAIKNKYSNYVDKFPQNGYRALYYSLFDQEI